MSHHLDIGHQRPFFPDRLDQGAIVGRRRIFQVVVGERMAAPRFRKSGDQGMSV